MAKNFLQAGLIRSERGRDLPSCGVATHAVYLCEEYMLD
jgi:hypothetical protein